MNMLDDILLKRGDLKVKGCHQIKLFISPTGLSELKRLVSRHFGFGDRTSLYSMQVHKSEYEYSYIEGTAPFSKLRRRISIPLRNTWFGLTHLEKVYCESILRT